MAQMRSVPGGGSSVVADQPPGLMRIVSVFKNTPMKTVFSCTVALDNFDPLRLYRNLAPGSPGFLQSLNPGPATGRYSIVALRTQDRFCLASGRLTRIAGQTRQMLDGDPFAVLAQIFEERRIPRTPETPYFPGGFFGYLGYDLAGWIEDLPRLAYRDIDLPVLCLDWVDVTATYDHISRQLTLASLDPQVDLGELLTQVRRALTQPESRPATQSRNSPVSMQPELSQHQFMDLVRRAKKYIAAGDIYQANLSCRFSGESSREGLELYAMLRRINPSPFACYLNFPGVEIISSSPERLVSLKEGIAETRPIAGTRPRGYTPPEDTALGQALLSHPKERAEHVMLIDLERNDLGKVCHAGSVEVNEFMELERYSHVTHIVSNVKGALQDDKG
ncbi:MAG TPA: anthranilate synthase component I family protein, partial [Geoalkalibacter subterraneus]|nr:anthranilate synthase component I family protein [Geoalkalibacter subterraneus]